MHTVESRLHDLEQERKKILDLENKCRQLSIEIESIQREKASKEELQKLKEQFLELKEAMGNISNTVTLLREMVEGLINGNREMNSDIKKINRDIEKLEEKLDIIEEMKKQMESFTNSMNVTATKIDDFMATSIRYKVSQVIKSFSKLGDTVKSKGKVHKALWYGCTWGVFILMFISTINFVLFLQDVEFRLGLDTAKWVIELIFK